MSGTSERPDEKDDGGKINALQIIAATFASTTAAVVADALGVYGTIIGVAVISVVSSVATALYIRSMHRTKKTFGKVVKARGVTAETPRAPAPDTDTTAVAAEPKPGFKDFAKRNWRAMATTSLVVFALSVGVLTAIALLSGQPAASYYDTRPPASTSQQPDDTDAPSGTGDSETPSPSSETPDTTEESTTSGAPSQPDETSSQSPDDEPETSSEQRGYRGTSEPEATDAPRPGA